ncbi:unnamed protein product [Ascophyllum nodosum]
MNRRKSSGMSEEVSGEPHKAQRGSYLRLRNNKTVLAVEENLQLALIRLIEAARQQADAIVSRPFGDEIFRGPPGDLPPKQCRRSPTYKDERFLFDGGEEMESMQQQPKAYAYLGGLREEGKLKYVFDRTSHARRESLASHLSGDFQPYRRGYRGTTVHSVAAWRRPNTALDRYATSGRGAMKRIARSEEAFKHQGVWVEQHKKAREQRRQKANDLLQILRSELEMEQMREIKVMRLSGREERHYLSQAMKERVLAADRIIRTIKHYGLLGNIEDAHYMMYALDVARRAGLAPDRTPIKDSKLATANIMVRTAASRRIAMVGDSISGRLGLSGGPVYSSETKSLKQGKTISPYAVPLTRPAAITTIYTERSTTAWEKRNAPRANCSERLRENADTEKSSRMWLQSKRLKAFRHAGQNIRKGREDDDTVVPALIPIPKAFGSGKFSKRGETSYTASKIMDSLRKRQVDPITGRTIKLALPLWHRATE